MHKTIFILILAGLLILNLNPIKGFAQEVNTEIQKIEQPTTETETEIGAQDLGISEPKVLPTSPLYVLKNAWRGIRLLTAASPEKKAELQLKFANEKLIELKKLSEKAETKQAIIQKQLENYQNDLEKAKEQLEKIGEKKAELKEKFQEKYLEQNLKHQLILQKLVNQVPAQAYEIIEQNREQHLERFKKVMEKVAEKQDMKEKIDNVIQEIAETRPLIRLQAAEVIKDLKENVPEPLKIKLQEVETENIKNAARVIQRIAPEKRQEIIEKNLKNVANPLTATEIADEIIKTTPSLAPAVEAIKTKSLENLIINKLPSLDEEKRENILEKIIEKKENRVEVLERVQTQLESGEIKPPTPTPSAPPLIKGERGSEAPILKLKTEQEQKQILPEKEIQPLQPTTAKPTYQPTELLKKFIDKEKIQTRILPIEKPQPIKRERFQK